MGCFSAAVPKAVHIHSFIIEKRDNVMPTWSHVATLPSSVNRYMVPDLEEGRDYHFRIFTEDLNMYVKPYEYQSPIITTRPAGECEYC